MFLSLGLFCAVGCNKPAPNAEPVEPVAEEVDAVVIEGEVEAPAEDAAKGDDEVEAPAPTE